MSSTIQKTQELLIEKNKAVKLHVAPTASSIRASELFEALDTAYSNPELANRVGSFNEKIKHLNLSYNPTCEKTKYVGGCTECRTFTEIVSRLCENFGCVQEYFTTNTESTDCSSFIVNRVNPTADRVTIQQIANYVHQEIRSATDKTIDCFTVPLVVVAVKEFVMRDAMCSCTALDAMAEALLSLRNTIAKTVDRAILYGNFDAATSTFSPIANFDSLNNLLPAAQKLTANSELETYVKIAEAIANIQDATGCPVEDISILARAGLRTRLRAALDNNNRPINSELAGLGLSCTTLQVACTNSYDCQSVVWSKDPATQIVTSDIWVGMKKDYALGKYMFPTVEPEFDINTGTRFILFNEVRMGGKLLNSDSFYKITSTF